MKRFGDLVVGDYVLSPAGEPVRVCAAYQEHTPARMFELEFEDGTVIRASGNHLWYVVADSDQQDYRRRCREARRVLRHQLDKNTIEALECMAATDLGRVISLDGMVQLLQDTPTPAVVSVVSRCAEAIGVCEEHTYQGVGFEDGGPVGEGVRVPMYDEARFAQQILTLLGGKYRRVYGDPLPGRVLNTTQLAPIFDMVELPDPHLGGFEV